MNKEERGIVIPITVKVKVRAARRHDRDELVDVTEAEITYVNVAGDGRPVPIVRSAGFEV